VRRQDSLYFVSKLRSEGNSRRFNQRTLEIIAGLLQCILPQSVSVQRILHARVPIVKFAHVATGIDCDVCLENEYVFGAVWRLCCSELVKHLLDKCKKHYVFGFCLWISLLHRINGRNVGNRFVLMICSWRIMFDYIYSFASFCQPNAVC